MARGTTRFTSTVEYHQKGKVLALIHSDLLALTNFDYPSGVALGKNILNYLENNNSSVCE